MKARHPALETIEVPDQGHAPLLAEADTISLIARFAAACQRLAELTIDDEKPPAVSRRGLLFTHPRSRDQG